MLVDSKATCSVACCFFCFVAFMFKTWGLIQEFWISYEANRKFVPISFSYYFFFTSEQKHAAPEDMTLSVEPSAAPTGPQTTKQQPLMLNRCSSAAEME